MAARCGDGFVEAGTEACDDGNDADGDACLRTCAAAACGDGVVEVGVEACDDGNLAIGDGCDDACVTEVAPPAMDGGGCCQGGRGGSGAGTVVALALFGLCWRRPSAARRRGARST